MGNSVITITQTQQYMKQAGSENEEILCYSLAKAGLESTKSKTC